MKTKLLLAMCLAIACTHSYAQQLIQGTLKPGPLSNQVELWLKPNFSNSTQYLYQIGMPIAFPASASPQPTSIGYTVDAGFEAAFGSNYSVSVNPVATATGGAEKYFNVVLIRGGLGASNSQTWIAGTEFKVVTLTFNPSTAPGTPVKLADYQDGGSDGQGNFYTLDGNANYYVTSNSAGNFYASSGNSTVGGTASAGYAQTTVSIPYIACNTPATPTVTNITASTADISWNSVSGALGYEYAVTTSSIPPASGTGITSTTYTPTGLIASTQYYVHVRTNCGSGTYSSWASPASFTTNNPSCTTPSGLAVNNITATAADMSWTAVGGVAGYEYAITTSASNPAASGTATTAIAFTATGLTTGTTYYLHVRSNCTSLYSSWTHTSFTTPCAGTTTPVASAVTTSGATLNWPAVAGAANYEYALTTSNTAPAAGTAIAGTSYAATGLLPGTTYYFYVRTACSAGTFSGWMNTSFTTDCPVTTPAYSNLAPNSATISWSPVTGSGGYEYAVTTSSTAPASGTATSLTTYNATGLTAGTTYYAYVRTLCSAGMYSGWRNTSFTTPYPPCGKPAAITIGNISYSTVIGWTAVSGATAYQVAITDTAGAPAAGTDVSGTSYVATGLQALSTYYVHVRTNCGPGGFSQWTHQTFTTPCLPPVLTASIDDNKGIIYWNTVNGGVNYEYALTTYLAPPLSGTNTTDTFHTVANLLPGTTYYFHVRTGCTAKGISDWQTVIFHTSGIQAYPNPVSNTLTINLYSVPVSSSGVLSIYDASGKLLRQLRPINNSTNIDMRLFAAGVYMIKYTDGSYKYTTRIVKL